jgi:hypothetical protein
MMAILLPACSAEWSKAGVQAELVHIAKQHNTCSLASVRPRAGRPCRPRSPAPAAARCSFPSAGYAHKAAPFHRIPTAL